MASARLSFRRESEMIPAIAAASGALAAGLPGADGAQVFYEVPLAAGVPDVVITSFDQTALHERRLAGLDPVADLAQLRTLVALSRGAAELSEVAFTCGISSAHLRRAVLPSLAAQGWIEPLAPRTRTVMSLHQHRPLVTWAVTVEAKRSNWSQAAAQASRHLAAADRAFVALDTAHANGALANSGVLAAGGIGVVCVSVPAHEGDAAHAEVVSYPIAHRPRLPKRHRRPSVEAKSLLGERVAELDRAGLQSGPTFLVFGRDLSVA